MFFVCKAFNKININAHGLIQYTLEGDNFCGEHLQTASIVRVGIFIPVKYVY